MMDDQQFKEAILQIARNRDAYDENEPAGLIYAAIDNYAERNEISEEEAIEELSNEPYYGEKGENGGVRVFSEADGLDVIYTTSDNSTWMSLCTLVLQALDDCPNGKPHWFDEEWYETRN